MNKETRKNFEALGTERLIVKWNHLGKILSKQYKEKEVLISIQSGDMAEIKSLIDLVKMGGVESVYQCYSIVKGIDPIEDFEQMENIPLEEMGSVVEDYEIELSNKINKQVEEIEKLSISVDQNAKTYNTISIILSNRAFKSIITNSESKDHNVKMESIPYPGTRKDFAEMVLSTPLVNLIGIPTVVKRISRAFIFDDWSFKQRCDYVRQHKSRMSQ